jgi:pimeloyl-ACP methyl ester carboxylesterase
MNVPTVLRLSDLRGLAQLGGDATMGVTDLVEAMHAAIARPDLGLRATAPSRTTGITGLVYRSIRGVTRITAGGLRALPIGDPSTHRDLSTSYRREAMLSALNGVLGDHLATTLNPLALPMRLHHGGKPLLLARDSLSSDLPNAGRKLLILVHGLCMNDLQWARNGHDHGTFLADALGYTPLYLNYNSGLSISDNGRSFAALIETLHEQWPTAIDEITIIGHSMGGLLARSACLHAADNGHQWLGNLRNMICMGSPHHGAPLERGGHWVDLVLGATPFAAPIARVGKIRSAGITDLRHGHPLHDREDDRAPLPKGVRCFAMAATTGRKRSDLRDRLVGDGLVPVASALGHHEDAARALAFPKTRQWVGYGMHHLDLLDHTDVADRLLRWLTPRRPSNH